MDGRGGSGGDADAEAGQQVGLDEVADPTGVGEHDEVVGLLEVREHETGGPFGDRFGIVGGEESAEVATALSAQKLIYLTDSEGVLDRQGRLVPVLDRATAKRLIRQGVIREGMIPKVTHALRALEGGVKQTHIVDGRLEHTLLLEMFTARGIGTEIQLEPLSKAKKKGKKAP